METEAQPLRIVWFMLHAGYIRFLRPALELLVARGHSVHLAFGRLEKDPGDARLARELAEAYPGITIGDAPLRRRSDGWRPLAALTRSLVDLGRYMHPRYADSPALRARMARKLTDHVSTARAVDPVTAGMTLRLVRFMESHTSERASRRLVAGLGAVEQAIPTSRRIDAFLRERAPDAVVVTPVVEFASSQVEYLKSAQKAAIPCAVAVASWDNLTGKGLIRVVPDRVLVWNDFQTEELVEMHGVPRERVATTGSAKFDEWFDRTPQASRDELLAKAGLAPGPFVLYVCSSPFIAPDEVGFVRRWLEALRGEPALGGLGVIVRPHPQNAAQWADVDLSGFGNVAVWPPAGAQPDAGEARADFFDSLFHSAAVIGINTSALIEAAILGKSVLVPLATEFSGTQTGTLHFRYLLFENGGFVHVGETIERHLEQLRGALDRGDEHAEQTRRFIESFVRPHGLGRSAAPILVDAVEALARLSPRPVRRSPRDLALRALLTPAAVAASIVGGVATSVRRSRPVESS
jgi:hypothetical protein